MIIITTCHAAVFNEDVLLVLYNAGETYGLIPVIKQLVKKGKNIKIVAGSLAKRILLNANITKELFIDNNKNILIELSPKIVITGTFSVDQLKLVNALKRQGSKIVSFYDAFDIPKKQSTPNNFFALSDYFVVADQSLYDYFMQNKKEQQIFLVEHPTVELWANEIKQAKTRVLKKLLYVDNNNKIILLVGTYGRLYQKVFMDFVDVASFINANFIISIHPKMEGEFEQEILSDMEATNLIMASKDIPLSYLASIADLLVCYNSTACIFAHELKLPVIYFDTNKNTYTNSLIADNTIDQIKDKDELREYLTQLIHGQHQVSAKNDIREGYSNIFNVIEFALKDYKVD